MKRNIAGALLLIALLLASACATENTRYTVTSTIAATPAASTAAPVTPAAPTPVVSAPPALTPTTDNTSSAGTAAPGNNDEIHLVVKGNAFDTRVISVIANTPLTIVLENKDSGAAHNLAIYTDATAKNPVFVGTMVTGPGSITYEFVAPAEAGELFFRCDNHPATMSGAFVIFSCC